MGGVFGGGQSKPDPPPPVVQQAPPKPDDKEVQEAELRARRAAQLARGRRATLLTSGLGVGAGNVERAGLRSELGG